MAQQTQSPFWQTMDLPAPGTRLSLDDYLALPQTPIHIEWHNGVVIYPDWSATTVSDPRLKPGACKSSC